MEEPDCTRSKWADPAGQIHRYSKVSRPVLRSFCTRAVASRMGKKSLRFTFPPDNRIIGARHTRLNVWQEIGHVFPRKLLSGTNLARPPMGVCTPHHPQSGMLNDR